MCPINESRNERERRVTAAGVSNALLSSSKIGYEQGIHFQLECLQYNFIDEGSARSIGSET